MAPYNPADFARGMLYPLRGLTILRRHPGLARFWAPPIVLTTIALVTGVVLAARYHDDLLALLWVAPSGEGAGEAALRAVYFFTKMLALLLSLGLAVFTAIALVNVFAAPFNDALSEVVEAIETGEPSARFSLARLVRDLGRTVRLELTKLLVYVAVMGPMLVLSWLVPGVGQVIYGAFALLFTSLYMALDYVDWPASRRGLALRERLALLRVRPFMTLGFGFAVAGCLFVPLLNLFFMPLAVAGGTRLFLDLLTYRQTGV